MQRSNQGAKAKRLCVKNMLDAAMIVPDNLIALPPSMEVAVAYAALRVWLFVIDKRS